MSQDPTPLDPQALEAQAGRLRALARGIVRDYDRAEDVAQETCLKALTGSVRPRRSLRACLGGVVRNVAWKLDRGDGRRRRREQAVARPEAQPDTLELLTRLEEQQRVLACVHALDEPYRSTILMRYFESMPPREIARRQGLPVDTVKTRCKRGLQQLRRALDAEHGGSRRAWLGVLLPVAGFEPWTGASTTMTGGIWMSQATGIRWAIGLAVALALGGGAWWATHLGARDEAGETHTPTLMTANGDAPTLTGTKPTAPGDADRLGAKAPGTHAEASKTDADGSASAPTDPSTHWTIARTKTDPLNLDAIPWAVRKSPFGLPKRTGRAVSAGAGMGGMTGHWTKYQASPRRGTAVVQVFVRDGDGKPLAGADVYLGPPDQVAVNGISFGDLRKIGKTDIRGQLEAVGLPRGGAAVFANFNNRLNGARGLDGRHGVQVLLDARTPQQVELDLPFAVGALGGIQGRILGPDGAPVRSASVAIGMQHVWTKADGAFEMQGLPEGDVQLAVRSTGLAPVAESVTIVAKQTLTKDLRMRYAEEGTVRITGRVVGPEDEPVAGARIYLMIDADRGTLRNTRTDDEGRFQLEGLPERVRKEALKLQGGKIPFYTAHQLVFPEGLTDEEVTIRLPVRYTQFELRVLDKDTDEPILECDCDAVRPESRRPKATLSRDYKTNFRKGMVEAGRHTVTVSALDHEDTTFTIDVQPDADGVFTHTIELRRTQPRSEQIALEVTVTALDGTPIETMKIEVLDKDTGEALSRFEGRREGGVVRMPAWSGARQLRVTAAGYEPRVKDVTWETEPGEEAITIQLRPR